MVVPKKKPPWCSSKEHTKAIKEEVSKLKHAGAIKEAHTVVVLTQLPSQSLLWRSDYTRRITKLGTILGAFDIKYLPRIVIKGQVLVDLVAEFTEYPEGAIAEKGELMGVLVITITVLGQPMWKLYVDGVANQKGLGVGIILICPKKITIEKSLRLGFSATNNEAEYEALSIGVAVVKELGGKAVEIVSDSRLVIIQINGELEARD
ncbi:uncharacterized protein LOC142605924 [Castanea sativa]|uniref:uncharacterized protein LOC142605924 n=1 Tax=Castanea sativa TaxID=21020 RepID=UPI003F653935